jgi:arginine N-succinyltransferase
MLFRRAKENDLRAIYELAIESGVGLTTLPKDRNLLQERLTLSNESFDKQIHSPSHEYYLFVLEDTSEKRIVGTAAIEALTGTDSPFYSYRHVKAEKNCVSLSINSTHEYLQLTHDNQNRSEICTLYLEPSYRRDGNGVLLSLARFLFMANHPHRFAPIVIAEMRGFSDERGESPFWNAVGYPFFKMSFMEADQLTLSNRAFIADLIPDHPLYLAYLPVDARAVIGETHPLTKPAMNILLKEGFHYNNTVDIFDAGPTLEVQRDHIRTIATQRRMTLQIKSIEISETQRALIATTALDFRATTSRVHIDSQHAICYLNQEDATLLDLKNGDEISISII